MDRFPYFFLFMCTVNKMRLRVLTGGSRGSPGTHLLCNTLVVVLNKGHKRKEGNVKEESWSILVLRCERDDDVATSVLSSPGAGN